MIVHECHHSTSDTYLDVMTRLGCMDEGGPLTVGCTATAQRTDKVPLGHVWQEIVYQRGLMQMIAEGCLVDVRGQQIGSDFNLANLRRRQVLQQRVVGDELKHSDAFQAVVRAYRQYASTERHPDGRLAVGPAPTVATAPRPGGRVRAGGYSGGGGGRHHRPG